MYNVGEEQLKQEKLNKDVFVFETSKKFRKFSIFSFLKILIKLIGKFFATCILLVIAAHFAPELREMLPQLYIFIEDFAFKIFNELYRLINSIIF